MLKLTTIALIALASMARAGDWEVIKGCRLIQNESNDGDSFHVKADGEERIFRLYFVDTPESEDGGRVAERVKEQAELFGITEEESVEMGKKAAAFTRSVLSRPFTVTTRGQNALGASKIPREYAFIETADGEDLGEMLVSRGLARAFGASAAPPGGTVNSLRAKYDRLESRARRERVGAWGEGADVPTLALPSGPDKEPTPSRGLPIVRPQTDPKISEEVNADIVATALASTTLAIGQRLERAETVTADEEQQAPSSVSSPPQSATSSAKVSVNGATQAELEALPEIGPKAAAAIIAGRPYAKVEDIDRVDGIGPKTMEAIRPLLTE